MNIILTGKKSSPNFKYDDIKDNVADIANQIQRDIPAGVGRGGKIKFQDQDLDELLNQGGNYLVEKGYATESELEHIEENGHYKLADAKMVSDKAKKRGRDQCGTLGAGNHFIDIQIVDQVIDKKTAASFGLEKDQITVLIHSGSRGLGHQVCTDYIEEFEQIMDKYKIKIPDRELVCAPYSSVEGQKYLKAMAAAANFAWANRQ